MELKIRKAEFADCKNVFNAIKELIDKDFYNYIDFEIYWKKVLTGEFGKCDLWVAFTNNKFCAYICANYFPIPRYIGFGVELEEIVTLPSFQRKGIGGIFITELVNHYLDNNACRKILIKTNDRLGSGRLYSRLFAETNMIIYQKLLNTL